MFTQVHFYFKKNGAALAAPGTSPEICPLARLEIISSKDLVDPLLIREILGRGRAERRLEETADGVIQRQRLNRCLQIPNLAPLQLESRPFGHRLVVLVLAFFERRQAVGRDDNEDIFAFEANLLRYLKRTEVQLDSKLGLEGENRRPFRLAARQHDQRHDQRTAGYELNELVLRDFVTRHQAVVVGVGRRRLSPDE